MVESGLWAADLFLQARELIVQHALVYVGIMSDALRDQPRECETEAARSAPALIRKATMSSIQRYDRDKTNGSKVIVSYASRPREERERGTDDNAVSPCGRDNVR